MNIVKKLIIAAAIPAFAVAVAAQAPAQKPAPKAPAAKTAPAKKEAAKPAPAKKDAAKPAPPKTLDQILSFLPNVLAEGKGVKITKETFIKELPTQIPANALAQVPADQLKPIVKQMVNGMIDRELVFSIAQKNGYKPSAQLVKNEFDNMLKQLPQDKRQMLESQLKLQGKTVDSYKNEIANDPMAQKGAAFSKYLKENDPGCKVICIGPCTAKKAEFQKPEVAPWIDSVITFEELQALFDSRDIDITSLPEDVLDNASYFGRIFARSGGLADAVAQGLKEKGLDESFALNAISCDGIEQCRMALLKASKNVLPNNFIEGMACVGGCIGGAGCLTHGEKNKAEVDKYGREAYEKTIGDALSMLKLTGGFVPNAQKAEENA